MATVKNSDNTSSLSTILVILGTLLIFGIIIKWLNDIKKNTSSDIVSEEGQAILQDPDKREKLREAIDHYHQKGTWEKLEEISEVTN